MAVRISMLRAMAIVSATGLLLSSHDYSDLSSNIKTVLTYDVTQCRSPLPLARKVSQTH